MKCQYCEGTCVKKGCYKRRQLYRCKECLKYQRNIYKKEKVCDDKIRMLKRLNNEGVGTSSISRVLEISKSSVSRKLKIIASEIESPDIKEDQQEYEVDELRTYIGNKDNECWIIYAINKTTKQVIDFTIGRRTRVNISKVLDVVKALNPKKIFTDKLNIYPGLIEKTKHIASAYRINHIERKNLDLRKDIKCLNRKTICYSKSEEMLTAKLKIYFFGKKSIDID